MTKETVRYPDGVVDRVEEVVEDGVFESKSEFYRFSAEYVLDAILPDYEPETYDYEEIREELESYGDFEAREPSGEPSPFVEAVLTVRKHCLRGEFEEAEAFVDRAYDTADVEAVVLEDLLERYRRTE